MLQPKLKVTVDYVKCRPDKCKKGVCAAVLECPTKLWKQERPDDVPYPIPGFCSECGICVDCCPEKAIKMLQAVIR
jgi:Pyruvate/2-oxoacid:ferredoxin oxidoreductase delta subunit